MKVKKLLVLLFVLILQGCNSIKIENTEICSISGMMSAGMDCAETLTPKTRSMNLDETIKFLEPHADIDPAKKRAGAMCQSAEDWNKMKTSLEQACAILGNRCTYELQQIIKVIGDKSK